MRIYLSNVKTIKDIEKKIDKIRKRIESRVDKKIDKLVKCFNIVRTDYGFFERIWLWVTRRKEFIPEITRQDVIENCPIDEKNYKWSSLLYSLNQGYYYRFSFMNDNDIYTNEYKKLSAKIDKLSKIKRAIEMNVQPLVILDFKTYELIYE